jgi:GDP-mannose 6-dehydrogenase
MNIDTIRRSGHSRANSHRQHQMRIAVVGLGHVGIVTAAALLKDGHCVVGVESDERIRDCAQRGESPFREPEVGDLIAEGHTKKSFSVTSSVAEVIDADLAFVCVGTRGLPDGNLDLSDVTTSAREFGEAVRQRSTDRPPILIAFRSTMLPGSMNKIVLPAIAAAAGEEAGTRYEVAYFPEFSREGSAVADYFDPPKIVIGERRQGSAHLLNRLFRGFDAPTFVTSFEVAELAKFADNSFHALKVAFANEVGRFALRAGASPSDVFDIFRADTKLNISAAYLRPGGAFGGPCLKKDVRALATRMSAVGIAAPVLNNVFASNELHTDFLVEEIATRAQPSSRLLLVGLSFKAGTDDVRDSPLVTLAEKLLARGYDLSIYDSDLDYEFETTGHRLPIRVAKILLPRLPLASDWDLAIVAKHASKIDGLTKRAGSVFRIDRL